MASPTLDSFCCALHNDSNEPTKQLAPYFRSPTYTTVCLVFAIFGVLGASYQILHNHVILERSSLRRPTFILRGRRILQWLGFADLMAAVGVILRCVVWLMDENMMRGLGLDEFASDFCIVTSAVTQYFYTATYMWTLLYAVDVLRTLRGSGGSMVVYGLWAWLVPFVLSTIGFLLLFVPGTNCHAQGTNSFLRHFPNYIFSNRERRTLLYLRFKFVCIIVAFYLCWLPNLVNGVLLWSTWPQVPVQPVVVIWYFMAVLNPLQAVLSADRSPFLFQAVLNPLQAVLNSLLYRSWDSGSPSIGEWLAERARALAAWCHRAARPHPEMDPLLNGASKSYDSLDNNG
ncbi:G-protein coupled receptor 143 [Amphibalanus amphitrite]|uniref:G-protein coupled receptor 143 n=1 Tax=Amphibalanus amphitrite TaxID=1232801 RepID=A0A6A4WVV3_AMPAM|nr:G-protein coupled receptor 143 [Amphibalanus amphitrite]